MRLLQILLFFFFSLGAIAQAQFVNPIEGVYGEDFVLVNYVDWGAAATIKDNHCSSKSYNGHQGTDFVLKSFRQMDEGVNVLAADSGVVIFTHDGEFDREKVSVISKGLGNYIGITHDGDFQTYYGHLKKNSILVNVGDTVYPGQVIAQVASSGNSTDPHLHFELWYDSTFYIDPFQGPCGNFSSYWIDEMPYDSSFFIFNSSTWNELPTLDTLREAPISVDTFDTLDSYFTYWSLIHGLRNGDTISLDWITPDSSIWSHSTYWLGMDWWYYYYWSYIEIQNTMPFGEWTINFYRNGELADSRNIYYLEPEVVIDDTTSDSTLAVYDNDRYLSQPKVWQNANVVVNDLVVESSFHVYSLQGSVVMRGTTSSSKPIQLEMLRAGLYVVSIRSEEFGRLNERIIIQ
jgi:hypothetical protein